MHGTPIDEEQRFPCETHECSIKIKHCLLRQAFARKRCFESEDYEYQGGDGDTIRRNYRPCLACDVGLVYAQACGLPEVLPANKDNHTIEFRSTRWDGVTFVYNT